MIDKAIAKITDEMIKINEDLTNMLEEHLTRICTTEAVAEKLLDDKKSLKELNEKIWEEAQKRRKGKGLYWPDDEICELAEEYYGITEQDKASTGVASKKDIIDITDLL